VSAPEVSGGALGGGTPAGGPRAPAFGWRSPEVQAELPELRLLLVEVEVAREQSLLGASPHDVQQSLRERSSRFRGARAVGIRREPVAGAYRIFFRHIGLDPDVERTPIEAIVLERILRGGFLSGGLLADVLLIALADTSVPVWALDSETLEGQPGVRSSREGEPLGRTREALALPAGQLVVADSRGALAPLFAEPAPPHAPRAHSRLLTLYAVQVAGVPTLYAEEALWNAASALEAH
jgi:DNA/RNA-binding domain of Phe-tRNA-synthetase-like protein